jgi:SAM-dependent methyltransferase
MNLNVQREDPFKNKRRAAFHSKFDLLPKIIQEWCEPYCSLEGKRILDFGCGEGTTALGIASQFDPELVVGTDINREYEECAEHALNAKGITTIPANLKFEEIRPGEAPREGDFDLIYSWSVFEHIDQSLFGRIVKTLRSKLRPNGLLFVQIAPLYYSAEGSHLWDIGFGKWEHLSQQLDHIQKSLHQRLPQAHADQLWGMFLTLNKMTAPKLVREIVSHGFELLRDYKTSNNFDPPDDLLLIYSKETLLTEQIVGLFRKV